MRKEYDFSKSRKNPHAVRPRVRLTLNIDSRIIVQAKLYAKQQGISLSKLVEDYLASLSA